MNYFEFRKEISEITLKSAKKWVIIQRSVTYLNIFAAAFNFYVVYHQNPINLFTAICTGALISNCLWCMVQLYFFKDELKHEKMYFEKLKESESKEEYKAELQRLKLTKKQYEEEKKQYEELIAKYPVQNQ